MQLYQLARYWLQAPWWWHDSVETCKSVIICEIIVYLSVIVQNKKKTYYGTLHGASKFTDSLERLKQKKNEMRFGTWNVTSVYKPGSLNAVAGEGEKYRLDLMRVQMVRWEREGTKWAAD